MTNIEGRKDDDLLFQKGGNAFPHIVFMDDEGGIVAVQNDRTVAGFQKTYKADARPFLDLRAKAQSGDATAQIDFALLEGRLGRITFDETRKRLEGKNLSDAQKAALADIELGGMISALLASQDEASAKAAMKTIADAFAAGRIPIGIERRAQFLGAALQHAMTEKSADLAQKAFDAIKPVYEELHGKDPRLQQWIRETTDRIEDMRASKEAPAKDEGIEEGCGEGGK